MDFHKTACAHILVVDDEKDVADLICRWLTSRGHSCRSALTGEAAADLLERDEFDLVVTDIMMPGISGLDLLAFIKSRFPGIAVIIVTAVGDESVATMTFDLGAWGYITKPFEFYDVILSVNNALERRRLFLLTREHECRLEQRAIEQASNLRRTQEEMVRIIMAVLASRNDESEGHVQRVGLCSALLAHYLRWDREAIDQMQIASQLHDIGKIGIPDDLLHKPEKLTLEEFEIVKKHTLIGAGFLEVSTLPMIKMAREIALNHHERWNGSGYPRGISRTSIPESARIVAIADVYDSLTHDRPYRRAMSEEKAVSTMAAYRDSFDPKIFDYFVTLLPQIRRINENTK